MSTRSRIGILESDGSVTSIYCHWDGYVSHHGPILRDHYATEAKVRALLALGDISILGDAPGEKHDFDARPDGMCTAYGRDRGESGTDAIRGTLESFRSDQRIAYLFDPDTSTWTYYEGEKSSMLKNALDDDEPATSGPKPATSGPKLSFGDLRVGDHFIFFPTDGDNSGHGGYLGAHRLFVKTGSLTANDGRGVESTMTKQMDVIKIWLG